MLLLVGPIVLFVITQLDFAQNAEGWFVEGLPWDIGRKAIVADILAPIWVLTVVVAAAINRRLLERFDSQPDFEPTSWFGQTFANERWVWRTTRIAPWLTVAIVIMSWTREWERFSEQPPAFWLVAVILITIGLSLVPLWWVRYDVFTSLHDTISATRTAARVDDFLFSPRNGAYRWTQLLVLSALTLALGSVVLSELDSLLKGMHPTGAAQVGINNLASVFELDLSVKPDEIADRVTSWVTYSGLIGDGFANAHSVATLYLLVDTIIFAPAFTVGIAVLLLHVRRTQPESLNDRLARSYQFLIGTAVGVLGLYFVANILENLMTWLVIDSIWDSGAASSWTVRLMWFASLFRFAGYAMLAASGLLILAFRRERVRLAVETLIAVRGELLVLLFFFLSLSLAQTADVIRGWTVGVVILTVFFATALAMVLVWTSARTLSSLRRMASRIDAGEAVEPATVIVPWSAREFSLRKVVVNAVLILAAAQILLVGLTAIPAGLGFTVPAAMMGVLWLLGVAMPPAQFVRGDRRISAEHRRVVPRMLGSLVYAMLGVAVVRAAVPQLVYAKHADAYLVFIILPIALGIYRLLTGSRPHVGRLELISISGVGLVGLWLIVASGDPELSPVALMFSGVMLLYGSMPFFYSYEPDSAPSRFVHKQMPRLRVQPLLAGVAGAVMIMIAAVVLAPVAVAGRIGTIAVVVLGATVFAAVSAVAVRFAERTRPPKILSAFRLRRTPVFGFMATWLFLGGIAATGASNDIGIVRTDDIGTETAQGVTVDDIWDRWEGANLGSRGGEAIPMVFVASSGGGVRAATWTAYVMDCVFGSPTTNRDNCGGDPSRFGTRPIIVTSGVSGGSLGLATYFGAQVEEATDETWVEDWLHSDFLAAPAGWLLFVDTPRSFIGFGPRVDDRADILELALEATWRRDGSDGFLSRGIFEIWREEPEVPPMVFNGTSVQDPCRFNASVLRATAHDPDDTCTSLAAFEGETGGVRPTAALSATQDLVDYLCEGQDVRLSTAVLLSARFPVVTPSGRVGQGLSACNQGPRDAFVADGGYFEGSAAGTLNELWAAIESDVDSYNASSTDGSCIVPFLIQIDNGYERTAASPKGSAPKEILVPIKSLIGSQFGHMASAREEAAITFDLPFTSAGEMIHVFDSDGVEIRSRYARLTTRAHPGVQAPLGWTLSSASFDDLRAQLETEENHAELTEVASWLSGNLMCVSAPSR